MPPVLEWSSGKERDVNNSEDTTYIHIYSFGHGLEGECDDALWERDTAGKILIFPLFT